MANFIRFHKFLLKTSKASGKNYFFILVDFISVRRKKGITLDEYYNFEFENLSKEFRNSFLTLKEKIKYLSLLNKGYGIVSKSKYFTHLLMNDMKIPTSELYLYYNPLLGIANQNVANSYNSVVDILKKKNVEKCVIKTVDTSHGEGVTLYTGISYDDEKCSLERYDGEKIDLSEILTQEPLIFESLVEQTKQFSQFNNSSVNTIRFITSLYPDGTAKIIVARIKFGRTGSFVDNTGSGGNINAEVDIETGKIFNVVQFDEWRKITPITHHSDTGALLEGVIIENWEEITRKVIQFQQSHPFLKLIGWDIAITNNGPVAIETNGFCDHGGQFLMKRGWKKEIEDCYNAWKETVK